MDAIEMTLKFDPLSDPEVAMVFNNRLATTFYLLWRRTHVVSDEFAAAVNRITGRLENMDPPITSQDVVHAIRPEISGASDFSWGDAERFSIEALPYLNGSASITWRRV